nr:MAG TPA: hypothetical protein [Caudoviricetes sp.]
MRLIPSIRHSICLLPRIPKTAVISLRTQIREFSN